MSKLFILLATMLLLTSCQHIDGKQPVTEYEDHGHITSIHKFTYDDHDYIDFEGKNVIEGSNAISASVVHSPNCRKCSSNDSSYKSLFD